MRKGISSIISVVLVLAVTITIVGVFSGWAPDLIQDVTDETGNQTKTQVNCNKASVEVVTGKYFSSDNKITAVVRNKGTIDLDNLYVEAWNNDIPMNQSTLRVTQGNFTTTNISATSKPTSIKAISQDCSNAEDDFEDITD